MFLQYTILMHLYLSEKPARSSTKTSLIKGLKVVKLPSRKFVGKDMFALFIVHQRTIFLLAPLHRTKQFPPVRHGPTKDDFDGSIHCLPFSTFYLSWVCLWDRRLRYGVVNRLEIHELFWARHFRLIDDPVTFSFMTAVEVMVEPSGGWLEHSLDFQPLTIDQFKLYLYFYCA